MKLSELNEKDYLKAAKKIDDMVRDAVDRQQTITPPDEPFYWLTVVDFEFADAEERAGADYMAGEVLVKLGERLDNQAIKEAKKRYLESDWKITNQELTDLIENQGLDHGDIEDVLIDQIVYDLTNGILKFADEIEINEAGEIDLRIF